MFRRFACFLAIILAVFVSFSSVGCAKKRVASAEVTTVEGGGPYESETTTKTTKVEVEAEPDSDNDGGGGLFSILGDIIAFPFRVLGAIF